MVRINVIDAALLTDEHLRAEFVEIQMLITMMKRYPNGSVPERYTLNTGHMSFFRNKYEFVHDRFVAIIQECKHRGFNLDEDKIWAKLKELDQAQKNNANVVFSPTIEDKKTNIIRIKERVLHPIKKTNPFHYYKNKIEKRAYIALLSLKGFQ